MNPNEIIHSLLEVDKRELKIVSYEAQEKKHVFLLEGKKQSCVCWKCNKQTKDKQDLRVVDDSREFRHMYLSDGKMIVFHFKRRYFRCKKCNVSFMETFSIEAPKGNFTNNFADYVTYSRWHMSGRQIAINTWTSNQVIHKILHGIDPDQITKQGIKYMQWLDEIYLGIDEHSFRGMDMVMMITELKQRKVLAILDNTRVDTLKSWLDSLWPEIRGKVKWLSTDMNKGYKGTVEWIIPEVISTVDKYHLVQEVNRMVDEVRVLNNWLIKNEFVKASDILKQRKIPAHLLGKKKKLVESSNLKV